MTDVSTAILYRTKNGEPSEGKTPHLYFRIVAVALGIYTRIKSNITTVATDAAGYRAIRTSCAVGTSVYTH